MSYGVQVEVPENQMTSIDDIKEIPVLSNASRPVLSDVAEITNQIRPMGKMIIWAQCLFCQSLPILIKKDLGTASKGCAELQLNQWENCRAG